MGQIKLATIDGLKGKDDCLDTISMLMYLNAWKPTEPTVKEEAEIDHWGSEAPVDYSSAYDTYIV